MTLHNQDIHFSGIVLSKDSHSPKKELNWLDTQITNFDELLRDNFSKKIQDFTQNVLNYICQQTHACQGVFFVRQEMRDVLEAMVGYAFQSKRIRDLSYEIGDGLVGQVAYTQKALHFSEMDNAFCFREFAAIKVKVASLFFLPLVLNNYTYGVLELAYLHNLDEKHQELLKKMANSIAVTMESILNHTSTEKLLLITQNQKELLNEREEELKQNLEEIKTIQEVLQKQNEQVNAAYTKLEKSNANILESIRYAKRIQEAILPSQDKLNQAWSAHFVIYQPKDIVSGDFYWYLETKGKKFVGVIDCTGHGVPGAFMSMIAHTLLNQIVMENEVYQPACILNLLHTKVQETIRHDASKSKDGMDLMLCCLEEKEIGKIHMSFSGAKCNLYFTHKDQLYLIKGDRKSIGESTLQSHLEFSNYETVLDKGNILYMTTDGLIDICNPKRKRFGKKRLTLLLNKIKNLNFVQQEDIFNQVIKEFQGDTDQRDDITLLTVRV